MGLSFLSGAHQCNQQPISNLYDSKFLLHFKAAISRDRLLLLIRFCRFDDAEIWDESKNDRFGTPSITNAENSDVGAYANIDEMLLKFWGHCRFRQYMPSKPGRYGIKHWILVDAENHCYYNAIPTPCIPWQRKQCTCIESGCPSCQKLVEPLKGSNCNITCDRHAQ